MFGEAVSRGLTFVRLEAEHFFAIDLQDSQRTQYGLDPQAIGMQEAQAYADQDSAWCALRGDRPLACFGINETFPGAQGVAWAFLGKGLGRDHLALTRFARDEVIGRSRLPRLEAIVRCADPPKEIGCGQLPLMSHCLQHATPEVRWAIAVGLFPVAVLRKFGLASETHMLLERIR